MLRRVAPTHDSNYYLNPVTASVQTCVSVHQKKGNALFGRNSVPVFSTSQSADEIIQSLNHDADEYQAFLAQSMPLDGEVSKMIGELILP